MRARRRALPVIAALALVIGARGAGAAISESEPNARGAPNLLPTPLLTFLSAYPEGVVLVSGEIDANDTDFYAADLVAGQLLLVSIFDDRRGERTDTRVGVFFEALSANDPAAPPVASNDDGGPGFLSRIAVPIDRSGTWKIGVTGYRDDRFIGDHLEGRDGAAAYRIVVSVATPGTRLESDLGGTSRNDALASADPLPAGGTVVRASLAPGDVDYFGLDLAEGESLTGSVFDLLPSALVGAGGERSDTRIGLFDPNGQLAAGDDDGGPGFLSNLGFTVPPGGAGRWTLAVSGYRDDAFAGNHLDGPFDYELVVATASASVQTPRCDVNGDAFVDRNDVDSIVKARGQNANGPSDPRDADGDGRISPLDARQCTLVCDLPNCAAKPMCGLVGPELLLPILPWMWRRTRARRVGNGG